MSKISKISMLGMNTENISTKRHKKNTVNTFDNCNNQRHVTIKIRNGLVGSTLALAMLVPTLNSCNDNGSRDENYTQEIKKEILEPKNIELTEGVVKNRDIREIKQITGLTEAEYKTATKMLLEFANKSSSSISRPKKYIMGTKYVDNMFGNSFFVDISEAVGMSEDTGCSYYYDKDEKTFKYRNFFSPSSQMPGSSNWVKIQREKNGDFTCIGQYRTYDKDEGLFGTIKDHNVVRNFTKDGILKDLEYIPETESETEMKDLLNEENEVHEGVAKLDNNLFKCNYKDVKGISFFDRNDKSAIAKFATALGLSDIEYINKNGTNIFFIKGNGYSYNLNLKKMNDDKDTFIGIANKVLSDGKSEIYLIKGEMFSTNKSDKLILSKMRVVQDGLDENSPVYKKYIKETATTGGRKTETSHELSGKSRMPWFQLFVTQKFYSGKLNSKTVTEIDELVTESNSDGKTIKILSIDKNTGKIIIQGE